MKKRSRKLLLSAGLLVAATSIPVPQAEAACSMVCPNGTVIVCEHFSGPLCRPAPAAGYILCGRGVIWCPP